MKIEKKGLLVSVLMAAVLLGALGCGGDVAVVVPDDSHNHMSGAEDALFYEIEPCEALQFDPQDYIIPVAASLGVDKANTIHLIVAEEQYYRVSWDGESPVVLNKDSLTNIQGTAEFAGFVSGETYILGVGHDSYPEKDMKLSAMWVGMIKTR